MNHMTFIPSIFSRLALTIPAAALLLSSSLANESRTWTAAKTNSTMTGTAIKYTGSEVTIVTDTNKTLKIKSSQLSEADRSWLEENKDSIDKEKSANPVAEESAVAKQFTGSTSSISRSGKATKEDPKASAKYYLILFSASWCGPCRAEMPQIVKEYNRKIKNNPDLELIHKSADNKLEEALDWAKQEKIPFPTVLPGSECNALVLGLSQSRGIPSLMVLTADGEKIIEGHPSLLLKSYQKEIEKYEAAKGGKTSK